MRGGGRTVLRTHTAWRVQLHPTIGHKILMSTQYGQLELALEGRQAHLLYVPLERQHKETCQRAPILVRASILHQDGVLEIPREHAEISFPLAGRRERIKEGVALPWFYVRLGEVLGAPGITTAERVVNEYLEDAFKAPGSFATLLEEAGIEAPPKASLGDVLSRLYTLQDDVVRGWADGSPPSQDFPLMDALWRPWGEVLLMREGLVKPVWADRGSPAWEQEVRRCACRRAKLPFSPPSELALAGWELRKFQPEEEGEALGVARLMGFPPHTQRIFKLAGVIPVRLAPREVQRRKGRHKDRKQVEGPAVSATETVQVKPRPARARKPKPAPIVDPLDAIEQLRQRLEQIKAQFISKK